MSIASDLAALGGTLKNNLEAKGVTGLNSNMGLTTLANKILNISTNSGVKLQLYYTYPDGWVGKLTKDGVGISNANVIVHEYTGAGPDNYDYAVNSLTTNQNGEINLGSPANMPSSVRYILEYNGVFSNIVDMDNSLACYESSSGVSDLTISAEDTVGKGNTLSIEAHVSDSNDNGLIGEVVTFSFSQNNSVFDTFEIVTDNYGDAVCDYIGQNRGEVTVTVECMSLRETYVIEDCLLYDSCSSDNTSLYTTNFAKGGNSSVNLSFDTDHYVLSGSGGMFGGITFTDINNLDNIEISVDTKLGSASAFCQTILEVSTGTDAVEPTQVRAYRIRGDKLFQRFWGPYESTEYTHSTNFTDQYYTLKWRKEGDTVSCSLYNENGVLLATDSYTNNIDWTTCYYSILMQTEQSRSICLKNIKIKTV